MKMKQKNRSLSKRMFVSFFLTLPLIMALVFGGVPENFQGRTSDTADVRGFLEGGVFLFEADIQMDQVVSFDGKYMDWNVLMVRKNNYRESVVDVDLSALAPISDTENVTMRHTTYIINKNMKIFYHPGGSITDNKGEHELGNYLTEERGC